MSQKAIHKITKRYDRLENGLSNDEVALKTLSKVKDLKLSPNPIHFTLLFEALSEIDSTIATKILQEIQNKTYSDSAESLFIEYISQLLYQYLPTEKVQNLLIDLLEELEFWLEKSKANEEFVALEIAELSKFELPGEVKTCLNERVMPKIHSIFDDTNRLKTQVSHSATEITQLKNELEKAHKVANTDELTGIPNRRGFNEIIKNLALSADTEDYSFALLLVDIDYFKNINDEYGHLIGDSVLRYLAKQLNAETKGKDSIARIGGEEFVILLPQTNYENAFRVAENLRQKVECNRLKVKNSEKTLSLTISVGVSIYERGENLEKLIDRADKALYQAKNSGRNKIC
ncbi:GGDEF domain-containing protein [Thiomicrorhabdus sp.]|uniref:GGDEF domain-containing protein n=1 Tax=Thiomicrorhabdus sp. TaxID=2039724 RepID=UPI002AA66186|nr:GGDEF domain-containing protein [Thiomicrorhabdus sp.]